MRRTATDLPPDFQSASDAAWHHVRETPGYLAEREAKFLMLAAACAPANGAIVEIGSFKGRSTIGLAAMAQRYGLGTVVAVDPHTSPSETDPDLGGQSSSYGDFRANLERAGVASIVDSRRMRSHQLAGIWNQAIRLLWIDGDHTYAAVKEDLARFRPYLERGGILAMHDVLGTWEGPLRVFVEDVLESDDFGPAGFCGSIGWAQYLPGEGGARRFRWSRHRLAWAARHLIPVARAGLVASGVNKWRYKLWRALAPHHVVDPARWVARVTLPRRRGP